MASLALAASSSRRASTRRGSARGAANTSGIQGIRTSSVGLRIAHDPDRLRYSPNSDHSDLEYETLAASPSRCGSQSYDALKVRFSATVVEQPEIEIVVV